jgi:hypothetical protein
MVLYMYKAKLLKRCGREDCWRSIRLLRGDRGCYREEWGKTGSKNSAKKTRRTAGNDTVTVNDNEAPRMNKDTNGVVGSVLNC